MESVQHDNKVELNDEPTKADGSEEVNCQYLDSDCLESETEMKSSSIEAPDKDCLENETEMKSSSIEAPEKDVLIFKKKKSHICLVCGKYFSQNAGKYNHMKRIHNIYRGEKTNIRCLEKDCSYKCSYKEKLQLHLVEEHGFNMDISLRTFNSYRDFLSWKEEFEKHEKTRFVKKSGSRPREEGVRVVYYYCSRSGTSICQNKEALEKQSSKRTSKSNHHCTASITCLELADGKVEVKVCATHYGHDSDLHTLRLTQTDKIQIVEQLIKGVPRDVVLDNIRSSASSEVDRIHLITMRDVRNIEKAYRLNSKSSTEIAPNITTCDLNNWVALMSESEHSPIVHFEEQGSSDCSNWDFTLVIMTVGQIEMAKKYGQSKVFYVPTYATNEYTVTNKYMIYSSRRTQEIHVATLIVPDSANDALPIAFMISNNFNKDKYQLFFECVKENVPELEANFVLTDDKNDIFQAWNNVFTSDSGKKPCYLWSNRYVDKDWRDNLITIPNEDVQESVYERLYSFLESPNELTIHSTLKDYVDNELLTNPLTSKFGNHFALKYLGSEPLWAGCYGKKNVAIHFQLNMERLSNEIEEVVDRKYLDKRFVVRIVQDLLRLISENQCYRQTKIQRQVQELPNHHKLAMQIRMKAISRESDSSWRVTSSKDPEKIFCIVTRQKEILCNSEPCLLFCKDCGACAHKFICSCAMHTFDKTMCKHIHAVATKFVEETRSPISSENSTQCKTEPIEFQLDRFWGRTKRKLDRYEINPDCTSKEIDEHAVDATVSKKGRKGRSCTPKKEGKPSTILKENSKSDISGKKCENLGRKSEPMSKRVKLPSASEETPLEPGSETKRKRKRPQKKVKQESVDIKQEQDLKTEENLRPHRLRVNILRNSKKKTA